MWLYRKHSFGGHTVFFRVILCDNSLGNMLSTNFAMMQHHNYSVTELENMLPWERDIYTALLVQYVAEENERIRKQSTS